ncbi:MAG TPA: glycosyltransferase family 39 protein [Polyangiaceae bacterium]|nr:glycosyltransferase family 39 protein [Polyangiaceae bacterium]
MASLTRPSESGPTTAASVPLASAGRRWLRLALALSLGLLALRLHVALRIGFGDAEALYVTYGLHPQPAYLDHPGFIGTLARLLAPAGDVAEATRVHVFTAMFATLVPWLGGAAARAAGASLEGVAKTTLALLLVPELSLGLFAFSPDLPLAAFWLLALALAAAALRQPDRSFAALMATLGAGVAVGLATLSKASGALLGLAVLAAFLTKPARSRWRTPAPWAGLAVSLVLVAPVVVWEARQGFPMLEHRLVTTQAEAGLSFRNLAALIGGQLLYVTPPFLVGVAVLLRQLGRGRHLDAVSRLLWLATLVPAAVLIPLCLWSRVAEPHWLAPAYLAAAVELGRRPQAIGRRLGSACVATGVVAVLIGWIWVATDLPPKLLGDGYRARYDLANDLHAWGPGRRLLRDAVADAMLQTRRLPVVVGPHWTVCAQAQAALGPRVPVGCHSPLPDDFDRWLPPERWQQAATVLYVSDDRFPADPQPLFPDRAVIGVGRAEVRRGGQVVRTLRVVRLDRSVGVSLASPR